MKNNDNKLEGVWIPLEVLQLDDLSISEKAVLAVIEALDNENGCFASNEYIATVLGVKSRRISAAVSSLKKKGYISVEIENFNSRIIKCTYKSEAIEAETEQEQQNKPMMWRGMDISQWDKCTLERMQRRFPELKKLLNGEKVDESKPTNFRTNEEIQAMTVNGEDFSSMSADALKGLVYKFDEIKEWLKGLPLKYVKTEWKDVYQLAFSL